MRELLGPNVALIELAWILFGLFVLSRCLRALIRTFYGKTLINNPIITRDLDAQQIRALELFGLMRIGTELLSCFIQVCFIIIGVWAATQPPPHDPKGSALTGTVFFAIEAACWANTEWGDFIRRKIAKDEESRIQDLYKGPERRVTQKGVFVHPDRRRNRD
jgi:hypothetical protein